MSGYSGIVQAGLQLGLDAILVRPKRGLYTIKNADGSSLADIVAMATIEENHHDDLEITEHPVEQGAPISDHAYKRPAEVTLKLGWSNSPNEDNGLVSGAIGAVAANSPTGARVINAFEIANAVGSLATTIQASLNGTAVGQMIDVYQKLLQLQGNRAIFDLYTGKRIYKNMLCKTLSTITEWKTENALIVTMVCKQVIIVNSQIVTLPKTTQATPAATASPVNSGLVTPTPAANIPAPAPAGQASTGIW